MKNSVRILLCFIVLNFPLYLHAKNFFFDQISLNEGLSQSTVRSVFRDHIGLLWIGTKQGLNRYDGSKIKTYYADRSNENSLPNDNISFIAEDEKKNLWIGSDGILCRYDRQNDTFIKEKINGKEISLQNVLIKGDYLYSVTAISIFTYNCKKNTWTEKRLTGDETNVTLACKLEKGTDGKILIGVRVGAILPLHIISHKAIGATVISKQTNAYVLTNGIRGTEKITDGEWLDLYDTDGEFTVDLGDTTVCSSIQLGMLNNAGMGIHFPAKITINASVDGKTYFLIYQKDYSLLERFQNGLFKSTEKYTFTTCNIRYLRFQVLNPGICPPTLVREGQKTRMAFDEVLVH